MFSIDYNLSKEIMTVFLEKNLLMENGT